MWLTDNRFLPFGSARFTLLLTLSLIIGLISAPARGQGDPGIVGAAIGGLTTVDAEPLIISPAQLEPFRPVWVTAPVLGAVDLVYVAKLNPDHFTPAMLDDIEVDPAEFDALVAEMTPDDGLYAVTSPDGTLAHLLLVDETSILPGDVVLAGVINPDSDHLFRDLLELILQLIDEAYGEDDPQDHNPPTDPEEDDDPNW